MARGNARQCWFRVWFGPSQPGATYIARPGRDAPQIPSMSSDAAHAVAATLSLRESHKINVAGPEVLTLKSMCNLIGTSVGRTPRYTIEANEHPNTWSAISTKCHAFLFARPFHSREG